MAYPRWSCTGLALFAIAAATSAFADDAYDAGQAAAADHQDAKALASFREAAAHGHRQSQLIAGGMLLHCRQLYGAEFPCDKAEATRWLSLAAAQGSEVSGYLLRHAGAAR